MHGQTSLSVAPTPIRIIAMARATKSAHGAIGLGLLLTLFLPVPSHGFEPLGVPDPARIAYPDGRAPSRALAELGKTLFFDPRLSANRNKPCADCHDPALGFGDGHAAGTGTRGNRLSRNTPPLYNLAWAEMFFWDGRARSLEAQALMPLVNPKEMDMPLGKLVDRLGAVPYYVERFGALFPEGRITGAKIAVAIAAFERTLIVRNTAFDRYMQGDEAALNPAAARGLAIFAGRANCVMCHGGPNFTDGRFHNVGIGGGDPGLGRFSPGLVTRGAFKTPGLRNAALTAPYMHNGSLDTLDAVVRHYNNGGDQFGGLALEIRPLNLTERQIADLVAFLESLTERLHVERPRIP